MKNTNAKKYLAIGLLATILTVSIAYGIDRFVTSNHLIGTSKVLPTLTLTGNMTNDSYWGDIFTLTANLTGLSLSSGRLIRFYCNNITIAEVMTTTGIATTDFNSSAYYVNLPYPPTPIIDPNNPTWDIYAEVMYT